MKEARGNEEEARGNMEEARGDLEDARGDMGEGRGDLEEARGLPYPFCCLRLASCTATRAAVSVRRRLRPRLTD